MGRPREKVKKSAEAANNNGGGGTREEAFPTAHERSASPQNPRKDDEANKVDENANVEEAADGVKPIVHTKGKAAVSNNGEIKRLRRRRQVERSSESVEDDGKGGDDVKTEPNGFRRNGSRRKNSTPRRAAEAGVECDHGV